MDEQTASTIYGVLVEVCRAPDGVMRESFMHHYTKPDHPTEWRFQGSLGFGGKLWDRGKYFAHFYPQRFYVDCYSEDRTPEKLATIEEANRRLAGIEITSD